jgi:hypothetical protein
VAAGSSLNALDPPVAAQVLNALLGGIWGWLGGVAAELGLLAARRPFSPGRLLFVLAQGLPGLLALWLFSRLQSLSRRLPDLRSYFALLAVGVAGGALSGTITARLVFGSFTLAAGGIWAIGAAMGVVLLVPLLLVVASALRPPWVLARTDRRLPAEAGLAPPRRPPVRAAGLVAAGVAMSLAAALIVGEAGERLPAAGGWLNLLFVLPVLWGASVAGLRGGFTTASVVGLCFLALRESPAMGGSMADLHREAIGVLPPLLLFTLLGALLGAGRDRERALRRSLAAANRQLREDLEQTVRALSAAIEAKDAYTEAHVVRVADYAEEVGRRLGLGEEELTALRWASTLHDVGKIGIPEVVLHKPGPLDATERAAVERHPEIGARILAEVPAMAAAAPLVLHHQERWDGRRDGPFPGYPAGLSGEAIPLGARIIAVVDTFDAMTTDRPYREARPAGEAIAELRRESGRQFDPRVVEAFLGLLAERPWA